ncbi:MAG: hypothetical protein AB4911_11360 [Oscillochloridaceae bacterium umkhey_bin13]
MVRTNQGDEDGGACLVASDGTRLRVWTTELEADLDAPGRRGAASRYSPLRIALRVLLASRERVGLLSNGVELRLLISEPARTDSQVIIPLESLWRKRRSVPDSYRLLLALAAPAGLRHLPELIDQARQQQTRVTNDLRRQSREAIEGFIQAILQGPGMRDQGSGIGDQGSALNPDPQPLTPESLWREGLVIVYRLLVILKLAASDDPARRFSFADSAIWRRTYAPGTALAPIARAVLDEGVETGQLLEEGLRQLFRLFAEGVESQELTVKPLAGGLFDPAATPTLNRLHWGERAVALLLDRLLWTPRGKGSSARERVSYAALDVEDLGRVYEALLELEPGIATEPMCRLRRQKLEVVVPLAQGEKYRAGTPVGAQRAAPPPDGSPPPDGTPPPDAASTDDEAADDDETPARGKKTNVEWIEEIHPGRFYLRVGLGRKATGSYYTPRSFVRFLVQETVGPQCDQRSPHDDPQPERLLALRLLDPAMGSGHFLVEACRFLGDRLYEACRRCDELASEAEALAMKLQERDPAEALRLVARAEAMRQRVEALPDPEHALLAYLPSRAREGDQPGLSEQKARALCRRLAAVHCLYGVDKNPLAVALARVAIWIEAHAEGLPLTFLDHRLVVGDSLTGPFVEQLYRLPKSQDPLDDLFNQSLQAQLQQRLAAALSHVAALEESVGIDVADLERKRAAKTALDAALAPFRLLAAAWAGGVMLGKGCDDDAYAALARQVSGVRFQGSGEGDAGLPHDWNLTPTLRRMLARGLGLRALPEAIKSYKEALALILSPETWNLIPALPYDLTFPEVFYPGTGEQVSGIGNRESALTPDPLHQIPKMTRHGFDVVVGNPPWDKVRPKAKEFFASFDFTILDAPTKREREETERRLKLDPIISTLHTQYEAEFTEQHLIHDRLYHYQVVTVNGQKTGGDPDLAKLFAERNAQMLGPTGLTGVVVPSAFHANEGATGIRRLYFEQMATRCCYSFENRNKLFEIDSRFKFAPIVAARQGPTTAFPCAFYLHDETWLFERNGHEPLQYSLEFVRRTGGEYLSLLEPRNQTDAEVIATAYAQKGDFLFGTYVDILGFRFSRELDTTDDAWRFENISKKAYADPRDPLELARINQSGALVLAEGKMFHQFNDRWGDAPRYHILIENLNDKKIFIKTAQYYRVTYRTIAASTNERTGIFCLLPPGYTTARSSPCDTKPENHPTVHALALLSNVNGFVFDFLLRQIMSSVTLNYFFLERVPLLGFQGIEYTFLAHAALRLTCNHAGYAALWREQVGEAWREEREPFDWPVLKDDDARWAVRAAIDAVVAAAYGLSREQYAHVLSTFSHKSYPQAPERCLAAFDELKTLGLEAFTQQHDPYWDIPLNEALPEPVIQVSGFSGQVSGAEDQGSGIRDQGSGVRGQGAAGLTPDQTPDTLHLTPDLPSRGRKRKTVPPPQMTLDLDPSDQVLGGSGQVSEGGDRGAALTPDTLHLTPEIIDFAAAAAARQRSARKAAEDRAGYNDDDAERYERIKALLAERGHLASGEVQFALGVDANTARALLRRLVDEGLARVEGEKRGTRYVGV